jgi:hypothetical protein
MNIPIIAILTVTLIRVVTIHGARMKPRNRREKLFLPFQSWRPDLKRIFEPKENKIFFSTLFEATSFAVYYPMVSQAIRPSSAIIIYDLTSIQCCEVVKEIIRDDQKQ